MPTPTRNRERQRKPRQRRKPPPAAPKWTDEDLAPLVEWCGDPNEFGAAIQALYKRIGPEEGPRVAARMAELQLHRLVNMTDEEVKRPNDARAAREKQSRVEREREAWGDDSAYWLEKYGEPLSDYDSVFRVHVSAATGAQDRHEEAARAVFATLRDLISRQWRERRDLLYQPQRGNRTPYRTLARDAMRKRETLHMFRSYPARLLDRYLVQYERATGDVLRFLRYAEKHWRPRSVSPRTRAPAGELARAAAFVAEFIRQKYPNRDLIPWDDVALALKYHGWETDGRDLRKLVGRWKSRHPAEVKELRKAIKLWNEPAAASPPEEPHQVARISPATLKIRAR